MAPGRWIASGNEHTVASASGVVYCSRSPIPLTSGESAVARITGTSLAMIEKHYGHLVMREARERLDRVRLL